MREVAKFGIDYCRAGKGPILIEAATYRYAGHSASDPGTSYRTREEVQEVRIHKDPISNLKDKLLKAELATEADLKKIQDDSRKEVEEAVQVAKTDEEVSVQELYADIYSNPIEETIRGITPFTEHRHMRINTPLNKA